jgi:hypothetical protein
MILHNHDNFNVKLEQLRLEEASIEQHLHESANSLSSDEVSRLTNDLIAVRLEKSEVEQIISGAFYKSL